MILSDITHQIMDSKENTIVYSNDGSAQSGVGNYVVQSISINGVQRTLPTLGIFTESRESLAELEKTTFQILSASTGYRFSEKEIVEHIDFVMTDSTSHNLGVIEKVCEDLESDSVNNKVSLSYMKKSRKTKSEWVFPEDAEIRETSLEQIILSKISVNYFCSIRVRCIIPDDTDKQIDAALTRKMS